MSNLLPRNTDFGLLITWTIDEPGRHSVRERIAFDDRQWDFWCDLPASGLQLAHEAQDSIRETLAYLIRCYGQSMKNDEPYDTRRNLSTAIHLEHIRLNIIKQFLGCV